MMNLGPGNNSTTETDFAENLKCIDKSDKIEFLYFDNTHGFLKA